MATRLAMGFGLAAITAVVLGASVTENGFVQIAVTLFAALALWLPFTFAVYAVERLFKRSAPAGGVNRAPALAAENAADGPLARLLAAAPDQSERIGAIRASLGRSRLLLGKAKLDPDAQELCLLIDRRLPELIDRELENLAPPGSGRDRQLGELVDLVEQFAGHCGARRTGASTGAAYEAAVLRRRFEARLSEF
ncbi:MAG: hypothetical protein V4513_04920 [Pseudomonadota bacterium]